MTSDHLEHDDACTVRAGTLARCALGLRLEMPIGPHSEKSGKGSRSACLSLREAFCYVASVCATENFCAMP